MTPGKSPDHSFGSNPEPKGRYFPWWMKGVSVVTILSMILTACGSADAVETKPVIPGETSEPQIGEPVPTTVAMTQTAEVVTGGVQRIARVFPESAIVNSPIENFAAIAPVQFFDEDGKVIGEFWGGAGENGELGLARVLPDGSKQQLVSASMSERELFGEGGSGRYDVFLVPEGDDYRPVVALGDGQNTDYFCPVGGNACLPIDVASDGKPGPGELFTKFAVANERVKVIMQKLGVDGWSYRVNQENIEVLNEDRAVLGVVDTEGKFWSSEFDTVQEKIGLSGIYTLTREALEFKDPSGQIFIIPWMSVDPETGKWMYGGGDVAVECDPNSIVIDGSSFSIDLVTGETITISDGKTWTKVEAAEKVDPLAWQEFGPNSEIIATGAGLTLWDGTPQEQRFTINQENAEKFHEGLFTFAAMANWHGSEAIRNQFANFMAYELYLKAHPEQEGAIIFESNYYAGNPNSRSQGKFVEVSEKVDYSQIAVAFEDVGDNPEKDGWINLGGGVVFKMNVIQTNEEANIIQFIFSNRSQFGVPEYGVLGLNSESTSIENGGALVQGLNLFISWGGRMASRERLSLVGINDDGSWFINFGFDSISKSYMNSMANGTEYIEPVGEELTDVNWDARVLLYNLSNLGAYALMAENSRRG